MALTHDLPAAMFADTAADWAVADDLPDVTDRRRLLVRFLFGLRVSPATADALFTTAAADAVDQESSSSTTRSAGRDSSTVDR